MNRDMPYSKFSVNITICIVIILSFLGCTKVAQPENTGTREVIEMEVPQQPTILPTIADVVRAVEPAVVSLSVDILSRGIFYDFTDEGSGTGMIVRSDGYIVTNYHVIQGARDIEVGLFNGNHYSAEIVGLDLLSDLAVIKIGANQDRKSVV